MSAHVRQCQWSSDAVSLAVERELAERMKSSFVLAIRGASTTEPELRRLEVRLTAEAQRAHTSAVVAARSGYYTKVASSAP